MTSRLDQGTYSPSSVTWGYRDIFSKTIQRLFDEGYLGPEREEITRQFMSLLNCSEAGLYDHVLKSFLDSLTGASAWIFDLPAILGEIIRTGSLFAEAKMFYGIEFYRILKDSGFGDSPDKVQFLLTSLKRLKGIDMELAFAFLKGYQTMLERLKLSEIQHFAEEGGRLFTQNTQAGLRFMQCKSGSAEAYIQELTRECRLEDIDSSQERLLRALTGMRILVRPLNDLESSQLHERGSGMICLAGWIGLPDRIRRSTNTPQNQRWYMLQVICAAAYYLCGSLPAIHGLKDYRSLEDVVGTGIGGQNLAAIIEHVRVLLYVIGHWPGARGLLLRGIDEAFPVTADSDGPKGLLGLLLHGLLDSPPMDPPTIYGELMGVAQRSENILATARIISERGGELLKKGLETYPALDQRELRPLFFLPDLFYRIAVGADPPILGSSVDSEDVLSSVNAQTAEMLAELEEGEARPPDESETEMREGDEEQPDEPGTPVAERRRPFLYDEWSNEEGTYYRGHCSLYEERMPESEDYTIPPSAGEQVNKVRRVFEMLKPIIINKIKRLPEGDEVNHDLLVQYLVDAKRNPSPKVDFYERPLVARRDLSVLVLLDVSGSTDEEVDGEKILDIEKQAAAILAQGLASLGDAFSLCGFSSNGRENCRYYVFKDFNDQWGDRSIAQLYSAASSSSTRIGVALRHAGAQLQKQPSRQRLIILITDGRPMDQGYDPETRYAQYDVRMACEENKKNGVLTFCVSTMENSRADMEIMFPDRRFVILKNIAHLPKVLPQLYIRLTT
jgi:hypothetical protein